MLPVDSSKNLGKVRRSRGFDLLIAGRPSFLHSKELPWPLKMARRDLESGERTWLLLGAAGED